MKITDILSSRGNKRTLTTIGTVLLGVLSWFPATAPYVPLILQGLAIFGGVAVGQAVVEGTLVSPIPEEPKALAKK